MIFDSGMMTHEESLVLRWLKNGTYADIHLGCASICRRIGGQIREIFFWRRGISCRFGQFVSLSMEAIFSFNFWEATSIVSLAKPKMTLFLKSDFGFEFGAKVCLFRSLSQVIPDWLVLVATDCEQSCRCSAVVLQA